MGVRTGLRPQQGVQKWVLPSWGGGGTMKSQKRLFTLKTAGKPSTFDPEHGPSISFWVYGPKKVLKWFQEVHFWTLFFTNPSFDPEDGRFSSWKHTFSESTRQTGLATWGSKLACGHSKGSKKRLFPSVGGFWPMKRSQNPFLTLKMADSALENIHFLNLQEKLA